MRDEMMNAPERPLEDWVAAIKRDRVDVVDLAGGEPLLVPWLPELLAACPETQFGLSTNGMAYDALERLLAGRPRNLCSINLSFHPETGIGYMRRFRAAARLMALYGAPCHSNIVDAPQIHDQVKEALTMLTEMGLRAVVSPFEDVETLGEILPQGLRCRGGIDHLTIAPDGSAWPCLTTIRSPMWRSTCLGNWLDGELDLSAKPEPCHLNCVDYYVLPSQHIAGDMWDIHAEPWAEDTEE
jgi:hypothetical protein